MSERAPKRRRRAQFGPTQKDIADALGVAQSTVAMALSPHYENRLLEETAQRIKDYAEKIGYHPQRFAQIMQGGQTKVIGVVIRLGLYAISTVMLSHLANEISRAGYRLVLVDPTWFDGDTGAVCRYLRDQGAEGVVICYISSHDAKEIAAKLPPSLPVIGLQTALEGAPHFLIDPASVYHDITLVHIALGAKHLGLLLPFRDAGYCGPLDFAVSQRAVGFIKAIKQANGETFTERPVAELLNQPHLLERPTGRKAITGQIVYTLREPGMTTFEQHAYAGVTRMINKDALPDVLICTNDDLAQGALAALSDNNVPVPERILLTGHGDTLPAQFAAVPITSIRPHIAEAVAASIKYLLGMIQKPEKNPVKPYCKTFHSDIILRRSSGSEEALSRLANGQLPKLTSRVYHVPAREHSPSPEAAFAPPLPVLS